MEPLNYYDGVCYVINTAVGQTAGRTPAQAQYTANLIMDGRVYFDKDGIGIRVNPIEKAA